MDDGSMDKNGANGSEAVSAATAVTAAAGSTDWQKGNPQLSALLSQQAVSSGGGGGAVVINGAAATAAGAVVSKAFMSERTGKMCFTEAHAARESRDNVGSP